MEHIKIEWGCNLYKFGNMSELTDSNDNILDGNGFYHIFAGTYNKCENKIIYTNVEKLYIGMAYDQSLRERIPQYHLAYKEINGYAQKHSDKSVMIRVGCIISSTTERITEELYHDIENALIYTCKPKFNTQCKKGYAGRDIEIRNEGKHGSIKKDIVMRQSDVKFSR